MDINPATRGHALVDPARPRARPAGDRPRGPRRRARTRRSGWPGAQGHARRRRGQPHQLVRRGRRGRPSSTSTCTSSRATRATRCGCRGSRARATWTRSPPPARRADEDALSASSDRRPARAGRAARGHHVRRAPAEPLRRTRSSTGCDRRSRALAADPPRGLLIRAEGRSSAAASTSTGLRRPAARARRRAVGRAAGVDPRASRSCRCPTVFAAHGLCLTAAFELSLACDLLLAAERRSSAWWRSWSG